MSLIRLSLPMLESGQRVMTPDGPGTIDSDIPTEVHRMRNRYAVCGAVGPRRYYDACELSVVAESESVA